VQSRIGVARETCSCGRPLIARPGELDATCAECRSRPDWCGCEPVKASDPGDPVAGRLAELRAALLDSAALDGIKPPDPVIDGLLYRDGIAWLYGKPGTYKSIIALDWACCVSAGLPWVERETVPGPVLYLYAEGRAGLPQRVRAWEDRAACRTGVRFLPVAVQIMQPVDLAAFTALVAELRPVLIVIDTQARVTVGTEENSTMEMGRLVAAVDAIRNVCQACVLIIHHEPRGGENMRGAIALEGAATSVFRADRDGSRIVLENRRQRDTAEAEDIVLQAVPRLESVVVDSNEAHWSTPLPSASEKLILQVLTDVFLESGASATTLIKATKLADSTFYYAMKNLVSRGEVVNNGTRGRSHYELPPKGDLQLTPMDSNSNAGQYSNSNPPFRGLESTGDRDSWPENSEGKAANQ